MGERSTASGKGREPNVRAIDGAPACGWGLSGSRPDADRRDTSLQLTEDGQDKSRKGIAKSGCLEDLLGVSKSRVRGWEP